MEGNLHSRWRSLAASLLLTLVTILPSATLSAPAANCPQLISASDQAFSQAGRQLQQAEEAYTTYGQTGDVFPAIEQGRQARSRITLAEEAIREVATNDCGTTEYQSKRNALSNIVERFNTLQSNATTQYQQNVTAYQLNLADYSSLVGNQSAAACAQMLSRARQQHSTILAEIQNLDIRAGAATASERSAILTGNSTIQGAATQLNGYATDMRSKNCSQSQIDEVTKLRNEVFDAAVAIENKYNVTSNSVLGILEQQAESVVDAIEKLFSCKECSKEKLQVDSLIDSFINSICCLLYQIIQSAVNALKNVANQVGEAASNL